VCLYRQPILSDMSISPVSAPELFVLAHLLAHDPDRRQWARSILIDLVQACSCTDDPIQLICDLHEVLLTPDTSRFSLDRITLQVEPPDRHLLVAALIAIGRHTECRLKAGAIDSRVIVAQRQMMLVVTLLWQWPTERLNQVWEDRATLSRAIADLRQQSSPIASVLVSYLERDLTPEPLTVRTESPEPTVADEALIELPTGPLLDSPQIVGAIARNTTIAREDYDWTQQELEPVAKAFATLTRDLGQRAKELEKVGQGKTSVKQAAAQQMAELYDKLERTRTQDLENLRTILKCKRDAIGHFTLAMMGRTKVGKSTLFATLLGSGYDGIGTGQQRTTRENRVYELENGIRLVDTPGIAAAGGEADALEALKAVDGADLICYVVTSDSIQESEFEFLRKLKDKTKPLLILLNVQKDLTNATRRKLFLKNPDKLMSGDDIEGHTSRILRYAREHYASESIVVLPVMLLAAQLARQEDDRELCSQLYRASRIQSFLDWVEGAIVNYGTLIASQTIIGETAVSLVPYRNEIEAQRDQYRDTAQTLRDTAKTFIRKIEEVRNDITAQIETEIAADYQAVFNAIPSFARNNWEKDQFSQTRAWENTIEHKIKLPEKVKTTIEFLCDQCNSKMRDIIEEIGQDLAFVEGFKELSRDYVGGFTGTGAGFDFYSFMKKGNILLIGASLLMSLNPATFTVAGAVGLAAVAIGIVSNFFKNKSERQQEACKKIEEELRRMNNQNKQITLEELQKHFKKTIDLLELKTSKYFKNTIESLEQAASSLDTTSSHLKAPIQTLDRSVSLRIYDWCNQNRESLDQTRLDQSIKTVQRNPGKLQIQLTQSMTQLPPKQRQTECSQILGIDVQFSQKP
jgi:small GTP-binding protein